MADRFLITDPSALRFLLLLAPIALLYMVRSHYQRRRVSSTMLWRSVRRDLEARQRLRLPPLNPLMLLQLLAILVGVAALVRPALPAQDQTHLVVLVDISAGMEATDVAPSRFAVAQDTARQAIRQMLPGDRISLVSVGPSPTLLTSATDTTEVLAALDHMTPGAASADTNAALKLAESLIEGTGGRGQVLLLSDGSLGPSFKPAGILAPVVYHPIGLSGDNQGITAVDVRPDLDGSGRWSAFARVANYAGHSVEVAATATADDLLLDTRQLQLGPMATSELAFALPAGTKFFALKLKGLDALTADDRVEVRVDTPEPRTVLLVSRDAGPIEKVLQTLPGLKVTTARPEAYQGPGGSDLVILDNFVPPTLPNTDLLLVNPPADAPGFVASPAGTESPVLRSQRDSSLIDSVDLQSLRLGQMVRLETPDWARPVVEGPTGALILEGDRGGRRVVIFNFDWTLFDLPRMQAFPLLLSNAVTDLNPRDLPRDVSPGDSVLLRPLGDATESTVDLPDGSHRVLSLDTGARGFGETAQVGQYTVRWKGPKLGEVASSFNVNVASEVQSNIAPGSYSFTRGQMPAAFSVPVPGLQMWPFLALLLLALLSVEWVIFARRS